MAQAIAPDIGRSGQQQLRLAVGDMFMAIFFGIVVGLALGLTGGGGSIFAVPLLIYGLGVGAKSAVAISLGAVAVTSAVGAAQSWRQEVIELRAALIFAVAGMAAAPLGVFIGGYVSPTLIVIMFASLMFVVAIRMALKAWQSPDESSVVRARVPSQAKADPGTVCHFSNDGRLKLNTPCSAALVGAGLIVGILSGLLGVGGGFLIVPALILVTEMRIHQAIGTSLLVITLTGLSGFASAIVAGREIDWVLTGLFILGGMLGMFGGRLLARFLAGRTLQSTFALVMIVVAVFMLAKELVFAT